MSNHSIHRKNTFSVLIVILILSLFLGNSLVPTASADSSNVSQPEVSPAHKDQPRVEPQKVNARQEPIPSQIIIKFSSKASEREKKAFIERHGSKIMKKIDALHSMVVHAPNNGKDIKAAKSPLVESIEPDYYISALDDVAPNDPRYPDQWALPAIGAPSAWGQMPADAPKVTIAVIDSGICAEHPDLTGRILDGWDFLESDAVPQDDFGHGCEVSGVIAANMNDGIGIAGVAPNAMLMPLRVLNAQGVGSYSDVAAAIVYAADHGAQVINLSLGGSSPSSVLEEAVNYAISKGVLVVAAAGNNGTEGALYPAAYPDVVAVGSVDPDLQHSSFSNYGPQIDIWAPGRDILTTKSDGSYGLVSGTSFAAPYVAGGEAIGIVSGRLLTIGGDIVVLNGYDQINTAISTAQATPVVASEPPTQFPTTEQIIPRELTHDEINNISTSLRIEMEALQTRTNDNRSYDSWIGKAFDSWVEISIWYIQPDGQPIGMEPITLLAYKENEITWQIYAPWKVGFNSALDQVPLEMISDDMKVMLHLPDSAETLSSDQEVGAGHGGFLFPWSVSITNMVLTSGPNHDSSAPYALDFANGTNFDILAPKDGEIVYLGTDTEDGFAGQCSSMAPANNYIVIGHGRKTGNNFQFYTVYYHLAHNSTGNLTVGSRVRTGQVIGKAGNTGDSSGVHLHFSLTTSVNFKLGDTWTTCDGKQSGKRDWPSINGSTPTGFQEYGNRWSITTPLPPSWNRLNYNTELCYPEISPVVLYEHRDFGGKCDYYTLGDWSTLKNNVSINQASSVLTQLGYRVQLYQGAFFGFPYSEYSQDTPFLQDWNDRANSLKVLTNQCIQPGALELISCGDPTPTPIPTQPTATLPPSSDGIEIVSVSSHVVKPGEKFNPSITIKLVSGALVAGRDHLHAIPEDSSNTFGAWPVQPIKSAVPIGGTYTFDINNDSSFHMTAPGTPGQYQSVWQMRVNGVHIGPQAIINITVKSDPIVPTSTPLPIDCNNPPDGITLYEFPDFQGRCINFISDVQYLGNTYFGDNVASSLRVVGNWGVTLFQDPDWNGTGLRQDFSSDDSNLSDNQIGDNTVSSLRVWKPGDPCATLQAGVTLYRGRDFTGISQSFSKDAQFLGNEIIGDNTANSIRICGNYKVTLYRDPDWTGVSENFTGSDSNLTDNPINDPNPTASSLRIVDATDPCNSLPSGVILYSETDFNGRSQPFSSDVQYLGNGNPPFGDNAAKSLRVCGHWVVTVFRDADWNGTWANFTGAEHDLGLTPIGYDASSLRMVDSYDFCKTLGPGVTLYQGRDFTGFAQTFTSDVSFLGNTNIHDNTATSIRQCGYNSRLYRDPDWQGFSEEFTGREESNLTDNQIGVTSSSLRAWTVIIPPTQTLTPTPTPVPAKPDLVPYDGSGWQFPLIPSSLPGDHSVGTLYAGQITYLDWGIFNNSNVNVTAPFKVTLYLDGVQINQFSYTSLDADAFHGIEDWNIYVDSPGYHKLKISVDSNNEIVESNENNNVWEGDFYWNAIPVTLTIAKTGFGSGMVTSNPAGINCGSDCLHDFPYNTSVTLTAIPGNDSAFYGWSGACTGVQSCVIVMTSAQSVTANFSIPGDANGDGKVDIFDYDIWVSHYMQQTSNGPSDGDFNNDGKVDGVDYVIWLNHFTPVTCPTITAWKGEYWNNSSLTGQPVLCRNDNDVKFYWEYGTPDPLITGDQFSARWTRSVNFVDGIYRFHLHHDDGARLYVDDVLVPGGDFWNTCCVWDTVDVSLSGGLHTIRLDYSEAGGAAFAELWWEQVFPILYMTENNGTLRTVNQFTGASTIIGNLPGNIGINAIHALSSRAGDVSYIYGVYGDGPSIPSRLVRINILTAETTPMPIFDEIMLGISNPIAYGIAISPTAPNVAVVSGYSLMSGNHNYLWKVNVNTGIVQGPAIPTTASLNQLTYNLDGSILYGVDSDGRLVTVNASTGVTTLVGDPGLSNFIEGLAFRPSDGALFAIDALDQDRLVRLDPDNGNTLQIIGKLGVGGPYGLAFVSSKPKIDVFLGGTKQASYYVPVHGSQRVTYALDSGPVKVESTNAVNLIAALRDAWLVNGQVTSFVQLMGLPQEQLSDTYYFPAYNNVTLSGQLRIANVDTVATDVTVTIAGVDRGTYHLNPSESVRPTYALDAGPMVVKSSGGTKIIAALRDAWLINGQVNSYAQLMGLPKEALSDTYYFPAYNNLTLSGQLRIGNVDTVATDVTVTIAGVERGTYHLNPSESVRPTFPLDAGPVVIKSRGGAKIIAALRDAWLVNGQVTSFVQLMGLPKTALSATYYFPAYNNLTLSGQLRIGNVDTVATDVTVTIAGVDYGPYHLNPNESVRPTFPLDAGPVIIKSSGGAKIIAALRDAWLVNGQVTSFAQLMGLPKEALSTAYYFPAYNNLTLSGQLRFGVP